MKLTHVVSTTLDDPSWQGSTVISQDVLEAVVRLKGQPGRELQVHASRMARKPSRADPSEHD